MAESAKEGPSMVKPRGRRIEISLAQVAGSAAATVTAAVLASFLGVYGTVIGAAVMSVVATSVGAVYQHLFRRTGEQLREVGVLTRPRRRAHPADVPAATAGVPGAVPSYDRAGFRDEAAAVRLDAAAPYSPGTVHGTRWRGRRRLLPAAAVVFATALLVITGIELVTGPIAGWFGKAGGSAPSISQVLGGGTGPAPRPTGPATPAAPATTGTAPAGSQAPGAPTGGATPTPAGTTASPGAGGDTPTAPATGPATTGTAPAQGTPSAPPATPTAAAPTGA